MCVGLNVFCSLFQQKIVLKLPLDGERNKRKAFKAAVGMAGMKKPLIMTNNCLIIYLLLFVSSYRDVVNSTGVTSATLEGDKIIIVGDGVDPIALTTMLRRNLGKAELLSISSGDDKKKDGGYGYGYGYGYGGEKKKDGYGYGGTDGGGGGGGKDSKGNGGYHQNAVAPIPYPAYHQYNAMPSYPAYAYAPYQQEQQDPGCSIM